jgi:hypothetical protein
VKSSLVYLSLLVYIVKRDPFSGLNHQIIESARNRLIKFDDAAKKKIRVRSERLIWLSRARDRRLGDPRQQRHNFGLPVAPGFLENAADVRPHAGERHPAVGGDVLDSPTCGQASYNPRFGGR